MSPSPTPDPGPPPPTTTSGKDLIRISEIGSRYFVFSAAHAMRLRREQNMCAVLAGTTPLAPSQNAFLSLPLELMVEEARLLLQKRAAYLVKGPKMHLSSLASMTPERRKAYLDQVQRTAGAVGLAVAAEQRRKQEEALARAAATGKGGRRKKGKGKTDEVATEAVEGEVTEDVEASLGDSTRPGGKDDFGSSATADAEAKEAAGKPEAESGPVAPLTSKPIKARKMALTPTCSVPDLIDPPQLPDPSSGTGSESTALVPSYASTSPASIPKSKSYPLYAYLHSQGYFMTPGLRFGCDYSVYPGDPMRFHAHFLATSFGWDEKIDMWQLVGPGRLATAVKKAFVIAGEKPREEGDPPEEEEEPGSRVRAFSIEWAGM